MQENHSSSRSVAPGHILLALIIAAAVAIGLHYALHYRAIQTATAAELSFDPQLARQFDSGLAQVHDPAVALAQSLLSNAEIEKLSSSANLTSTSAAARVGEFRARLQLTQPSSSTLRVRFLGPDGSPAVDATNTIAQALADLHPTANAAPLSPPPSPAPGKTTPPPAPVKKAPPAPANSSASGLAAATGDVDTLLASTKHDLDNLAASGAGGHPSDPAAYRESDQQHLLRGRVNTAEQKLAAIRKSPAAQNLSGADSARLGEMQHAVASIIIPGVGVDAARLRRERAQLDDAIAVVQRDQLAFQKEAPSSGNETAASTPPPANPPAANATQPSQPPAAQQQPTDENLLPNPLSFARPAGPANPTPWWPAILAGLFCGLVYFLLAPRRSPDYVDYDEPEAVPTGYNFITPSIVPRSEPAPEPHPETRVNRLAPYPEARVVPVEPASREPAAREPAMREPAVREPAPRPAPEPFPSWQPSDDRSPRRASFRFDPAATSRPPAPFAGEADVSRAADPALREASAHPPVSEPEPVSASPSPRETQPPPAETQTAEVLPPEAPLSTADYTAAAEPLSGDRDASSGEADYDSDPLFDFFAPDPPATEPQRQSNNRRSGEVLSAERGQAFTEPPPAPDARGGTSILLDSQSGPATGILVESPADSEASFPVPLFSGGALHMAENTEAAPENRVPLTDTWAEDIRRALAQTEIGRRFGAQESNGDAPQDEDRPASRNHSDRRAG
jgi:hypothetical protein